MDNTILALALERTVAKLASTNNFESYASVRRNSESTFQQALVDELSALGTKVLEGRHTLDALGGLNIKGDSRNGVIDFAVEEEGYVFAFELKVVGVPPVSGKRSGYNVMQIGQDVMRLTILDHSGDSRGVGGGWIIILGAGEDLRNVASHEEALVIMHSALNAEMVDFLAKTNGCVGNFSDARSVGGCIYLGLSKQFDRNDRSEDCYFARTVPGSGMAALAAWVGWE